MTSHVHVSLPKPFSTGDAVEWFQRYEICSRANSWDNDKKVLKLPTLLEGEALAVWLELTEDEQKDYAVTKKKIVEAIMPMRFVSLEDFHKRALLPGEPLSVYLHQLKQLLNQAMPDLAAAAKEQLLLHQFLEGLPQDISKQLRATGVTNTLSEAVERAKLIMAVDCHKQAAAVSTEQTSTGDIQQLQEQLTVLSEQVAALSIQRPAKPQGWREPQRRCFLCNRVGHLQRTCPLQYANRDIRRCFTCNKPGHEWRNCPQGNDLGAAVKGSSRPQQH